MDIREGHCSTGDRISTSHGQAVRELLEKVFAIPDVSQRYQRFVFLLQTDLLPIQVGEPGNEPGFVIRRALNEASAQFLREQVADALGVLLTVQLNPVNPRLSTRAVYNVLVVVRGFGPDPSLLDGTLGSALATLGNELYIKGNFFGAKYCDTDLDDLLRRAVAECIPSSGGD